MFNKKIFFSIIIVLIIVICSVSYYYYSQNNDISLGNSKIQLSSNYNVIKYSANEIILKDKDNNNITIKVYENKTLDKLIDEYKENKQDLNQTVKELNLTNNIRKTLLLSSDKNVTYVNYWFEKNNNQFRYTINIESMSDEKIDSLEENVLSLINQTY